MNRTTWWLGSIGVLSLVVIACLVAFVIPGSCITCSDQPSNTGCFRAAVLDHVHQSSRNGGGTKENIKLNLKLYETAAKTAKEQGADIIVFPENGIVYGIGSRANALKYGEILPESKTSMCTDSYASSHPIAYQLACLAKEHQMFVAADMIDVQTCQTKSCPIDKKYAFNTAVLFDRNGHLLGKYHKMHPFGELQFNVPPKDELVVIETEIGRLSMQVCFDLIYNKPGVVLASQDKIDTMLFPTWWFDELPFLAASQYQMSWAFGNKINLLASNIHLVAVGSKGSGIFAGGHGQFEVISEPDAKARILVATLPINARSDAQCSMDSKKIEVPQMVPIPSNVIYNYQMMNLTENTVKKLDPSMEAISACDGGVCCQLNYQMDQSSIKSDEEYYLIVTNRTRPGAYPWTEEYCGLVLCPHMTKLDTCKQISSNNPLQTKFLYAKLSGEFSSETHVYPSVIGSEHKVLPKDGGLWTYEDEKTDVGAKKQKFFITFGNKEERKSYTISTIGLYGRVYARDPPYEQKPLGESIPL